MAVPLIEIVVLLASHVGGTEKSTENLETNKPNKQATAGSGMIVALLDGERKYIQT